MSTLRVESEMVNASFHKISSRACAHTCSDGTANVTIGDGDDIELRPMQADI